MKNVYLKQKPCLRFCNNLCVMKRIVLLFTFLILIGCKSNSDISVHFFDENIELYSVEKSKGTLILFPCFPCDAENTKQEFSIIEKATKKGVNVLMFNYNQKLYLKDIELLELKNILNSTFNKFELASKNLYIGGFSSGGNVSLLLSNYLIKSKNSIIPRGVFIVDSPIDLLGLYRVSEKNIKNNYSTVSVEESNFIIEKFNNEIGNPNDSISSYEKLSPYTFETNTISNLNSLENVKIRFYIEPDFKWWKENRNQNPEGINVFYIEELYKKLKENKSVDIELIKTVNKGYRNDGTRHPHSWSIVDQEDLLEWILETK